MQLIAKTLQGMEDVLAEELVTLGANDVEIGRRMVAFSGDKEFMYKANFHLRTALRILMPVATFTAVNADEVYEGVKAIDWRKFFKASQTFCIDTTVFSESFKNSQFLTYRVKDGVVDHFTERYDERPSVRLTAADIYINVHIAHNLCTVSMDSSGESLHKRGYRKVQTEAPLNEVLAAGMILKTGWRGDKNFVDPMCGSGTLLIEAAMIALNIPAGIYRKGFAFERWEDYDEELFDTIYNDETREREFTFRIYGSDISPRAIDIAEENIKSAGLFKYIDLKVQNLGSVEEAPENAVLVVNPPYGERVSSKDLLGLYDILGQKLKHVFKGYDAWVLSYHRECFDQIGLKPSEKIELNNGGLDCEFRKYVIFDGKYNDWKSEGNSFGNRGNDEEAGEGARGGEHRPHKEFRPRREDRVNTREDDRPPRKEFRPRWDEKAKPYEGDRPVSREFKPRWDEKARPNGDSREPRKEFRPRQDDRFAPREGGAGGERREYRPRQDDRFAPREGGAGGERREYRPRQDDRSGPRTGGAGGERREYRPRQDDRSGPRTGGAGGERREYRPRQDDRSAPRTGGAGGERREYRPRQDDRSGPRTGGAGGERREYRPRQDDRSGPRTGGAGGERREYRPRRDEGSAPREGGAGGERRAPRPRREFLGGDKKNDGRRER